MTCSIRCQSQPIAPRVLPRLLHLETKKGQWVDTISDQVSMLSFYIGLPIGYYAVNNSGWIIGLGIMNVFFFLFFIGWSFYFLTKYTDSGSLVSYMKVDNFIDTSQTSFMRKFISFLRPLGRRNFYSMAFLVMAIFGGYPVVFFFATVAITFFFIFSICFFFLCYFSSGRSKNHAIA